MADTTPEKERAQSPASSTMVDDDDDGSLHDDRPLVKDLLEKHAEAIESVRKKIISADNNQSKSKAGNSKLLWDAERYDDIWILRYVLTHKSNNKAAAKAAYKTMQFRDKMKMNEDYCDIGHRILNHNGGSENGERNVPPGVEPLPVYELYDTFCGKDAAFITQPDPDRGVLVYCDVGAIDMNGIAASITKEQLKTYVMLMNEAIYQVLDAVTRRTGRLTKQHKIIDMSNVSLLNMNRHYIKRDAAISKELEDFYPQLLGYFYVANSPSWLSAFWAALRPFFPKRFVEKVDILPSSASKKLHPPMLRSISEANLPERYGGKNQQWPLPSVGESMAANANGNGNASSER